MGLAVGICRKASIDCSPFGGMQAGRPQVDQAPHREVVASWEGRHGDSTRWSSRLAANMMECKVGKCVGDMRADSYYIVTSPKVLSAHSETREYIVSVYRSSPHNIC